MRDGSYKTIQDFEIIREKGNTLHVFQSGWTAHCGWDERRRCVVMECACRTIGGKASGTSNPVCALAFSPDGAGLVSGGRDRTVRYWNFGSLGIDCSGLRDDNTRKQVWKWKRKVPVAFNIDSYIRTDIFLNRALLIVLECHPMAAGYCSLIESCLFGIFKSMSCSANYPAAKTMDVSGLFLVSLII